MKDFTYTLTAGETRTINRVASHVRCTASTASFKLEAQRVDQSGGDSYTYEEATIENGIGVTYPGQFNRLTITNTSGSSNTITLYISDLVVEDSRQQLAISGTVTTLETVPDTFLSSADVSVGVTATAISGADSTLSAWYLRSEETNTAPIRIGSATVSMTSGFVLYPGDAITISTTAAIYGISSAAGQTITRARTNKT